MKFSFMGTYRNRPCDITWEDGELSGDGPFIDMLKIRNAARYEIKGPPPVVFENESLDDPLMAFWSIRALYDSVYKITGDIPRFDDFTEEDNIIY